MRPPVDAEGSRRDPPRPYATARLQELHDARPASPGRRRAHHHTHRRRWTCPCRRRCARATSDGTRFGARAGALGRRLVVAVTAVVDPTGSRAGTTAHPTVPSSITRTARAVVLARSRRPQDLAAGALGDEPPAGRAARAGRAYWPASVRSCIVETTVSRRSRRSSSTSSSTCCWWPMSRAVVGSSSSEQRRLLGERRREDRALALAARERVEPAVGRPAEVEAVERRCHGDAGRARSRVPSSAEVRGAPEQHVVARR